MLIREDTPGIVHIKEHFTDRPRTCKEVNVLKRRKSISDFKNMELLELVAKNTINREKKKDLESVIEYLPENFQEFYRNLCNNYFCFKMYYWHFAPMKIVIVLSPYES